MSSAIHSVAFLPSKSQDWTNAEMRKWLKEHDLTPIKGMRVVVTDAGDITQYRWRIIDPKEFKRFTTKKVKHGKKRINLIIGWY